MILLVGLIEQKLILKIICRRRRGKEGLKGPLKEGAKSFSLAHGRLGARPGNRRVAAMEYLWCFPPFVPSWWDKNRAAFARLYIICSQIEGRK
jgi:hypothetical protein